MIQISDRFMKNRKGLLLETGRVDWSGYDSNHFPGWKGPISWVLSWLWKAKEAALGWTPKLTPSPPKGLADQPGAISLWLVKNGYENHRGEGFLKIW